MEKIIISILGIIFTINCYCIESKTDTVSSNLSQNYFKLPINSEISIHDTVYIKTIENPPVKADNFFEKYIPILKDILTILVIIVGSFFGVRKLTERLSENHLKELITTVHESNKQVRNESIKLTNKYIKLSKKNTTISLDELKEVYTEISKLIEFSGSSSKEIANYCFLLHKTIEGVIKYFNDDELKYILARYEIFNIVNYCLSRIVELSTSVAIVPKKIKTDSRKFITGIESKFLTDNKVSYYKGLRYGLDFYPSTPIYYQLFEFINFNSTYLFSRAYFEIYMSYYPMLLFMEKYKFYFPPVLQGHQDDLLFGKRQLALIYVSTATTMEDNPKKIYKLHYSNLSRAVRFIDSELKKKQIPNEYFDSLIPNSQVDFSSIKRISNCSVETIQFEVYEEDVVNLYKINKKKIKKILLNDKRRAQQKGENYIVRLVMLIRNFIVDLFNFT